MKNSFTLRSRKTISNISTNGDFCLIETYRRNLRNSALLLFLSLFAFVFIPYVVADANATDEVSATATWVPITLELNTGGNVTFGSITPSNNNGTNLGTMVVSRKEISITSTGKATKVYLSTNTNSSNTLNHDSTNISIPAIGNGTTTGTWSNPTTFSGKGWGYAVPDKTVSGSTIYDTPFSSDASFASVFNISAGETTTQLTYSDTGYNGETWSAVPLLGSEQLIYDMTTTNVNGFGGENGDKTRNHFDVYYAVIVDDSLISGTYSNSVVYTALASSDSLDNVSSNIAVDNLSSNGKNKNTRRFVNNGNELELTFDLSQSQAGLVDRMNTAVFLVPHSTIVSANYSLTDAIKNNKNAYPRCLINSDADYIISNDGTAGATINCTISNSISDSAPSIADSSTTNLTDGFYDVWLNVEKYDINYLSRYELSGQAVPTLVFAGLQSKDANGFIVDKMQDMTAQVCNLTNMWGTDYGTKARVYDYTGTTKLADGADSAATVANNTALGVGTFQLTDIRDTKTYLVRRLADGNCWMVQNLDLELGDAAAGTMIGTNGSATVLTDANTDLNSKTSYVPTTYTAAELYQKSGIAGQNYTYQPRTAYGTGYRWGSLLNENGANLGVSGSNCTNRSLLPDGNTNTTGTVNGTVCVENNSRVAIPRSYDNGSDWIQNDPSRDGVGGDYKSSGTPTSVNGDNAATLYIGNWYNWYAATAESGTWEMKTDSVAGSAEDSICPAGWQLPVNGASDDKSWGKLLTTSYGITNDALGSQKTRSYPLSIIFSGYYDWISGGRYDRGTSGAYWSSTPYAYTYSHYLYFNSTNVGPHHGSNKAYGLTVRCVAR